jgi:uncharacterized protein
MLTDALCLVSWRAKPRSFVALMALYESNYVRLAQLTGNPRLLQGSTLSQVPRDCDLRLSVTERSPYTTTFDLTYLLGGELRGETYPDMQVRVYHDACLVEALGWSSAHGHSRLTEWRGLAERELDQRWGRNTMLNKWLEYCLDRGHRFGS